MANGQVALGKEPLVLRVKDRLVDVRAGEALNCRQGFPEADRDEPGVAALNPPQRPRQYRLDPP
jgi:hypothetical protein